MPSNHTRYVGRHCHAHDTRRTSLRILRVLLSCKLSSKIRLNAAFHNWEAFDKSFQYYRLAKHFSVTKVKRDKTRYLAECKGHDTNPNPCPFKIRAIHSTKTDNIKITNLQELHTCSPEIHECPNAVWRNSKFVSELVGDAVKANPLLKPKEIMSTLRLHYGVELPYQIAYKAKNLVMQDIHGDEQQYFNSIPDFVDKVRQLNPGSVSFFEVDNENKFTRSFVAPAPCIRCYELCRKFACVDATFLKTPYNLVLALVVGIDANDNNVILAFGLIPSESADHWSWFLSKLKLAYPK